jgi:hypothetical protein
VPVEKIYVDPVTRRIEIYTPTIPGSGILATTFPPAEGVVFPASQSTVGNILVEAPQGNIVTSAGGIAQVPLNGVNERAGTVTLVAGSVDSSGKVLFTGNIDATGSGVIGSTVNLTATGQITGLVVARDNVDIVARQNVSVTALAQGIVTVTSGGTASGTYIGIGGISATAVNVDAALLSQNIVTSGALNSNQIGFTPGTAAAATSQAVQPAEPQKMAAAEGKAEESDELKRKTGAARPRLSKTVGRVTLIMPKE